MGLSLQGWLDFGKKAAARIGRFGPCEIRPHHRRASSRGARAGRVHGVSGHPSGRSTVSSAGGIPRLRAKDDYLVFEFFLSQSRNCSKISLSCVGSYVALVVMLPVQSQIEC